MSEKIISIAATARPEFQRRLLDETIPWKMYFLPRFKILCKIEPDRFQLTGNSQHMLSTASYWPVLTGVYSYKNNSETLEILLTGTEPTFIRRFSYVCTALWWILLLALTFFSGNGGPSLGKIVGALLAGCLMTGLGLAGFNLQRSRYEEKLREMERLVARIASEL